MSDTRQLYTQASNPNPYAPQPHYPVSQPSYNTPTSSSPPNSSPIQSYNYGQGTSPPPPGAQAPYHYSPEKQQSMSVQQPQATYQQPLGPQGTPAVCIPSMHHLQRFNFFHSHNKAMPKREALLLRATNSSLRLSKA